MRTWRRELEDDFLSVYVLEHRGVVNLVANFCRYEFEERSAILAGHCRFVQIEAGRTVVGNSLTLFRISFQ